MNNDTAISSLGEHRYEQKNVNESRHYQYAS